MLASTSPRQKELLAQIGLGPEIRPNWMEEETRGKKPDMVAMELFRQKTEDVTSGCLVSTMVIGVGTIVSVGNEILGELRTPMRAYEMLEKIQDKTHRVYTGVTMLLCQGKDRCHGVTFAEHTNIHVYLMTCREMKEYARCNGLLDGARAYGIQGRFAACIKGIGGDYADVVGLPVRHLYQEVKRLLEGREDDWADYIGCGRNLCTGRIPGFGFEGT